MPLFPTSNYSKVTPGARYREVVLSSSPRSIEPFTDQAYANSHLSDPFSLKDSEVIDVTPPRRWRWRLWLIVAALVLLVAASRSLAIYLSAAWFASLGFSAVYWYIFKLKLGLGIAFFVVTVALLRTAFWVLEKAFSSQTAARRTIIINNQPVQFSPQRYVRPLGWVLAILFGLFYGVAMKNNWQAFALYFNQSPATLPDPIFNNLSASICFHFLSTS